MASYRTCQFKGGHFLTPHAGTAEPFRVSPPEAVVYQVLIIWNPASVLKHWTKSPCKSATMKRRTRWKRHARNYSTIFMSRHWKQAEPAKTGHWFQTHLWIGKYLWKRSAVQALFRRICIACSYRLTNGEPLCLIYNLNPYFQMRPSILLAHSYIWSFTVFTGKSLARPLS